MEHHPVVIIGQVRLVWPLYELIKAGIKSLEKPTRLVPLHRDVQGYHFDIRPIRKFYTLCCLICALSPDSYAISYVHGKIRLSDAKLFHQKILKYAKCLINFDEDLYNFKR